MLQVTVIKSPTNCATCGETEQIVSEISQKYVGKVEFRIIVNGTPEAGQFGVISTPVVALGNKIYSMGKP
ncbi:MAG: thioredoxin family protein, partial [Candidatus Riflebacteria bacterium]|nr:thioredoxin family protein [Candidatus Riflebacteria bacterium]